jgi:hypothetical protein
MSLVLNSIISENDPQKAIDLERINLVNKKTFHVLIELFVSAVSIDIFKRDKRTSIGGNPQEHLADFEVMREGMIQAGEIIQKILSEDRYSKIESILYRSFGAQDFVIEIQFNSEDEFKSFASLVLELRNVDYKRIKPNQNAKNHHVFSQVNAIVSFDWVRVEESQTTNSSPFMEINQKIRIAPGHEFEAMDRTRGTPPATRPEFRLGFEGKNLHLKFKGTFKEYVTSRKTDVTRSRQNIGSVQSELTISEDSLARPETSGAPEHQQVLIKQTLHEKIKTSINRLNNAKNGKLLSTYQIDELTNLMQSAYQGLSRNDKQANLIDLIPFLFGIPEYIDAVAQARASNLSFKEYQTFLKSLDQSLDHLSRAVRNRIDELSSFRDPMTPSNRTVVANKLISAYSSCAHYAWEILGKWISPHYECHACAFVGGLGQVVVHRPLKNIHKTLRDQFSTNLPRLLFYDLSGPLLYRPEVVFLNTIHELAEETDGFDTLETIHKERFRAHFLTIALARLQVAFLGSDAFKKSEWKGGKAQEEDEKRSLLKDFVVYVMNNNSNAYNTDDRVLAAIKSMQYLFEREMVINFKKSRNLDQDIGTYDSELNLLNNFVEFCQMKYPERSESKDAQTLKAFRDEMNSLGKAANEFFADFAMYFHLLQIRARDSSSGSTTYLSLQDAVYLNHCLLEAILSSMPSVLASGHPKGLSDNPNIKDSFALSEFVQRALLSMFICDKFEASSDFNYDSFRRRSFSLIRAMFSGLSHSYSMPNQFLNEELPTAIQNSYDFMQLNAILPKQNDSKGVSVANYLLELIDLWFESYNRSGDGGIGWLGLPKSLSCRKLSRSFIDLWDLAANKKIDSKDADLASKRVAFLNVLWCQSTVFSDDGVFE